MPSSDTTTRVVSPTAFDETELAERIALFALVHRHPRVSKVLEGLAAPAADAAKKFVAQAITWPSSKRQGRAALEFGNRADERERLAQVMAEAPGVMRLAMWAQMTPQQQARFPKLANQQFRHLPGRDALAARLIREATR